jgi:hypothetical protein
VGQNVPPASGFKPTVKFILAIPIPSASLTKTVAFPPDKRFMNCPPVFVFLSNHKFCANPTVCVVKVNGGEETQPSDVGVLVIPCSKRLKNIGFDVVFTRSN